MLTDKLTRRLAIIRFAQLTAVLPGNAYRMLSLLRKTRVVYDPRHNWAVFLHSWQHILPHLGQHLLVAPGCVGHQVMQRLMHATNIIRGQARSHRFDALAFTGQ